MSTPTQESFVQVINTPSRSNGQFVRLSLQESRNDLKQNHITSPSSLRSSNIIHIDSNAYASNSQSRIDSLNNISEFEVVTKPNCPYIVNSPISQSSSINSKSTITSEQQFLKENFMDTIQRSPSQSQNLKPSSYVIELNDRVNKLEKIIDEKNDIIDLHQQRFTQLKQKYDQMKEELQVQENWRQQYLQLKIQAQAQQQEIYKLKYEQKVQNREIFSPKRLVQYNI